MKQKIRYVFVILLIPVLAGCGLFGGGKEEESSPTTPPPETPTSVVIDLPTPTPLPVEFPVAEDTVSLLDTALPPLDESLPVADSHAVQMPRFSAGEFSFVPPPGWIVTELEKGYYIVHRGGDDPINGTSTTAPYVYLKTVPSVGDDIDSLKTALDSLVLANLAGAQVTDPVLGVVIDGKTGVWQFVNGRIDAGSYRAFLLTIPAGENALAVVAWSLTDDWAVYGSEMAKVLETMRFPKG